MLEIALGVWAGLATVLTAILAVYIRLYQPDPKHNGAWLAAFGFLGVSALAATITLQVVLYQQRQETSRVETERDKQVSEVKGSMTALLALIPSLKSGNPDETIAAVKQTSDIQSRLSALESRTAPRRISDEQTRKFVEALKPCAAEMKVSFELSGGDPEIDAFARQLRSIFVDAGIVQLRGAVVMAGGLKYGMRLGVHSPTEPRCAKVAQTMLEEFGFPAPDDVRPQQPADTLVIEIGSKLPV